MPLISPSEPTLAITVQARTAAEPSRAFAVVVPIDLTIVLAPEGSLPGVVGLRDPTGPWDHPGARRTALLSDGSHAAEQITEYVDGCSFASEVTAFTGSVRHLTRGARAEWTFTLGGGGALIRWTYEFAPRRGRRPLLRRGDDLAFREGRRARRGGGHRGGQRRCDRDHATPVGCTG